MLEVLMLDKVYPIYNDSFTDHRGEIFTVWNQNDIEWLRFNHDKIAKSKKNVIRGLHGDKAWKLISCVHGKIQLVVVNFIKSSPDFLHWTDFILDANDPTKRSILVPPGFLNGHAVLSDEAIFHYKWSYGGEYPDVDQQTSINWADPTIGIRWMVEEPILSERDINAPKYEINRAY
jgi:dTDP-4-dehydrorhamnose 3,5-epimerase